ncbi:MAG: magnesium transporter [Gammaproteobacteria bacterium]|jgi:magnesium transporter|nr:magnesium transporter [Gammaproteobacteria bacterium]
MAESIQAVTPLDALTRAFLLNYPRDAARKIETMVAEKSALLLRDQPTYVLLPVWANLSPGVADDLLLQLPDETVAALLTALAAGQCASLLSRFDLQRRERFLGLLDKTIAAELRELLEYPADTAGALMETNIVAFNANMTAAEALTQLRNQKRAELRYLFLLNDDLYLQGQVPIQRLALAEGTQTLESLSTPLIAVANALDPKSEIVEILEKFKIDVLPVIDGNDHFVGVIRGRNILSVLKQDMATDMQTMVGVSKDERALSSSWFAVKKRLPWLQINLLTAFLAAAVVGMFESTIAQYTALAILLPIAAGQSGNTGAQALAVTMRGLTLREITVRHWLQVTMKEAGAALVNGVAVAITCGGGVYLWSRSTGLSLIIALAMISSMLIAAVAGALVPIMLKRLGQDPALSSSIILTTVTDIAGFMSFLGIATLLSGMLAAG